MQATAFEGCDAAPHNRRLIVLCVCAIVAVLFSYWTKAFTAWGGDDGLSFAPTANASVLSVSSVSGPAERAGIRIGERVDRRELPVSVGGETRNAISRLAVTRNGRTIQVNIVPATAPFTWDTAGRYLAEVWTGLFALLIAVRARRWPHAAPLAWILGLGVLTFALFKAILPWWPLTFALQFLGSFGAPLTFGLLVRYFATFGRPIGRVRLVWTFVAYCAVALSTVGVAEHFVASLALITPYDRPGSEFELFELLLTCPIVPCFVCGVLAARSAGPADGQRVGWIVAAYGTFWCFWLLAGPMGFVWNSIGTDVFYTIWKIEQISHVLVPLVLSYAALSRRLFDTGFVVSRTLVFGALSVLVVGCFVLLEWSLGKWFEDVSHTTSLALNGALALGLGLSMRVLHNRVDSVVDNVFFRKRYENERALRRFADEATFITSRDALLERTVTEICDRSEASFTAVRLADDLPPNDPAVLALQAWRQPIDLAEYRSALEGEFVFPMLVHAEFLGAIVCGEKKNGERYAPDEINSLKEVARGVGIALWSLGVNQTGQNLFGEILARLTAIERKLSAKPDHATAVMPPPEIRS